MAKRSQLVSLPCPAYFLFTYEDDRPAKIQTHRLLFAREAKHGTELLFWCPDNSRLEATDRVAQSAHQWVVLIDPTPEDLDRVALEMRDWPLHAKRP
jgi:hypothetical protein